jgi:hypothetical protein
MRVFKRSPVRNYRSSIDLKDEAAMQAAATSASHVCPARGNAPGVRCRWRRYLPGRRPAAGGGRRRGCRCMDQQRTLRATGIGASSRRPSGSATRASRRWRDERGRCRSPDATWADVGEPATDWPSGRIQPPSSRLKVAGLAPVTPPQDRPPRTWARRLRRGDRRGRTPPTAGATAAAVWPSPRSRRSAVRRAG